MTIEGTLVRYDGRLWTLVEVDGTSVHLALGSDGVCVECTDVALLAALKELLA